jgi:hypothetical protein
VWNLLLHAHILISVKQVLGFEIVSAAVEDARKSAIANGCS